MKSVRLGIALGASLLAGLAGPAAADTGSKRTVGDSSQNRDAYAVSMGRKFLSTNISLEDLKALQRRFSGDFLWVRRAKKTYLLRDSALLAQARAVFDPLKTLEPDREALRRLQEPVESRERELDREQEALEREAEKLEGQENRSSEREAIERKQRALEDRERELEQEQKRVDALETALDQKEEALESELERELWRMIDSWIARGLARRVEND